MPTTPARTTVNAAKGKARRKPAPARKPATAAKPTATKTTAAKTTAKPAAAKTTAKPAAAKTTAKPKAQSAKSPSPQATPKPVAQPDPKAAVAVEEQPAATPAEATAPAPAPAPAPEQSAPPAEAPSKAALFTMVIAMAGGFIALLDTTIVNVSMQETTARFGGINQVQWVVTAYLLALAAVMPATGWLATRFGTKRVFAAAVTLFALGSLGCAAAQSLDQLIAARGISGAAAGVLTPVSTILLTRGVPREHLGRVQALNGSVMLIGPLLGPTIGGLLVGWGGWSAVYVVNIPFCAVLLAAALRWVRKDAPPAGSARPLDVLGLVSSATATVSTVLAIHEYAEHGARAAAALLVPVGLAVLGTVVFVVRELRAKAPLLDLRLFRIPVYATAVVNIFCLGFVLYSPMMLIPLYFESARGESAVNTGLLMSVGGLGVVTAAWLSRVLLRKIGGGATVLIGIGLTMLATVPMTGLTGTTAYPLICASLVVRGLGTGLTIVPTMTRAFQSIRQESIPDASSQLNLTQRIGGALAIAVVTVVLTDSAKAHRGMVPAAFAHSFGWLLGVYGVTLLPALALLLADRREKRQQQAAN
ncbi:DHA2 family efflux MFS transporter permease subunit [Kitasatospora sp. YST-16]|uniref:DHA2 family efflux MFS transporter permease subunit n=1 Tax=Kitasatospora sp. YST-16 TaxID=2998080 RepID=UPI0022836246|nr:DHA2 family efflux MFS transporter permease subunit [Kitasatospora sp. YST-16]WAL73173.1 DHA2 family efflux MFS transporter permease subunit [Kitasatospora sp. YST-16]WNW39227.1 DHA2 family efflux MFS transporter permease subunit [Streptomyces sp. Li-HN-5-13]